MTSIAPYLVHVRMGGAKNPRRVPNILRISGVGVQNKLGYLTQGCQKPGKPMTPAICNLYKACVQSLVQLTPGRACSKPHRTLVLLVYMDC